MPDSRTYLHGIDLTNGYPVHNLSLSGHIMSPDYLARQDPGVGSIHRSLRDVPIETLMNGDFPSGMVTPRSANTIFKASLIRRTGGVGIGVTNTQWATDDEVEDILRNAKVELEFERIRRINAPQAASRLASLWVAEDSPVGESHIRRMLGQNVYIASVDIPDALRITKVDTGWFDRYCEYPKEEYIQKYWSSDPYTAVPRWEFLVEGTLRLIEPRQLEYIRKFGAKF